MWKVYLFVAAARCYRIYSLPLTSSEIKQDNSIQSSKSVVAYTLLCATSLLFPRVQLY